MGWNGSCLRLIVSELLNYLYGTHLINLEQILKMALLQRSLFQLLQGHRMAQYIRMHCHSLSMNMALEACTCIDFLKSLVVGPSG